MRHSSGCGVDFRIALGKALLRCMAGAEAKYAAHAGILDSARAIVNDLRKTGILRKLFHVDPNAAGSDALPPIYPASRTSTSEMLGRPHPEYVVCGSLTCALSSTHTPVQLVSPQNDVLVLPHTSQNANAVPDSWRWSYVTITTS